MQGHIKKESKNCKICRIREREELSLWSKRFIFSITTSSILLIAGLLFETFLKQKILAQIMFLLPGNDFPLACCSCRRYGVKSCSYFKCT